MALPEAERHRRERHVAGQHNRPLASCPYCPGTKQATLAPPVTNQSPDARRKRHITFAVKAFLDDELALPDRHHGPKRRWQELSVKVNAAAEVPDSVIKPTIEWALQGVRLGLVTEFVVAQAIATSWVG